jgi:Lon protease-like protein
MTADGIVNLPFLALPETVFFPHTFIDLDTASERHVELFRRAQKQGLHVGIFLAREVPLEGISPPYEQPGTFGRVASLETAAKGVKVTLHGEFRADVLRITRFQPIAEADLRVREDHLHFTSADEMRGILTDAIELVQRFKPVEARTRVSLPPEEKWAVLFTMLLNSIASFLPVRPAKKQEWLGTDDLLERYRKVREEMVRMWSLNQLMEQMPFTDDPRLN